MKQIFSAIFLFLLIVPFGTVSAKDLEILSIGFGSCLHQDKESPILKTIQAHKYDYFILLGDNIYSDTLIANEKIPAYEKQVNRSEWKTFVKQTQMLFTWDDHDYGINDSGSEYPEKQTSRELFLKYWQPMMPKNLSFGTKSQEGIFYSHWVNLKGKKIHIVVPDTRYFRSPLQKSFVSRLTGKNFYTSSNDLNRTILGDEQWLWLLEEISKPSDFLVFVSSIQVIPTEHPFEKWGNFPHERNRILQTLQNANTKELVILSGDRHIAEIHEYKVPGKRSIVEITSSSLNLPLPFLSLEYDSEWKIGKAFKEKNYGELKLISKDGKIMWKTSIQDLRGESVMEYDPSSQK